VTETELRTEVRDRSWVNRFSKTHTPLREGADRMNVLAHQQFCRDFGLAWSAERPRSRTPGWDFTLNGVRVKVYATSPGRNMLVKRRDPEKYADVCVLYYVNEKERVRFVGWIERELVVRCHVETPKVDGAYTQPAHFVPVRLLDGDIDALRQRLDATRQPALF
jgi:hypothetical protein